MLLLQMQRCSINTQADIAYLLGYPRQSGGGILPPSEVSLHHQMLVWLSFVPASLAVINKRPPERSKTVPSCTEEAVGGVKRSGDGEGRMWTLFVSVGRS